MKKMTLDDFKQQLISKYHYAEYLAETIAIVADTLIDYHGEDYESIICDAVLSCKFIVAQKSKKGLCESVREAAVREGFNPEGPKLRKADERSIESEYIVEHKIQAIGKQYRIDEINRAVVLNAHFDPNNTASLANLATEMEKLVKGYIKGEQIEGNELQVHNGISTKTYKLSGSEGYATKKLVKSENVALESGMTEYAVLEMMRTYHDDNYDVSGYADPRIVASVLIESFQLRDLLWEAEMTKDLSELKKLFDEYMPNGYNKFVSLLDRSAELNEERMRSVEDPEKAKQLRSAIDSLFTNSIATELRIMSEGLLKDNKIKQQGVSVV